MIILCTVASVSLAEVVLVGVSGMDGVVAVTGVAVNDAGVAVVLHALTRLVVMNRMIDLTNGLNIRFPLRKIIDKHPPNEDIYRGEQSGASPAHPLQFQSVSDAVSPAAGSTERTLFGKCPIKR